MLLKTEQKYLRASPRKIKPIAEAISHLSPQEALERLKFSPKKGAKLLSKVLRQAIANAVNNKKVKEKDLKILSILVNKGPTFKRWQPVSRGRAHPILKRTCHIKVILKTKND